MLCLEQITDTRIRQQYSLSVVYFLHNIPARVAQVIMQLIASRSHVPCASEVTTLWCYRNVINNIYLFIFNFKGMDFLAAREYTDPLNFCRRRKFPPPRKKIRPPLKSDQPQKLWLTFVCVCHSYKA